jgi:predicted NACHT family NTPase
LLDGLDEVNTRLYQSLKNQIRSFIKDQPNTPIVMTCRIAARDYVFQEFRDIEMADFGQEQIENFSKKWFESRNLPERATLFLKRLEEAPPIRELGSKPLLLALLCLVFEDGRSFEGPRGKLYKEALDVLITKWDLTRDIERNSALNPDRLELLLEHVAFENFRSGQLFGKRRRLRERIEDFLRARSLSSPKRDVLRTIESDYGLIVTRAKNVYCFSHLTFQEYLTARSVARNPDQFESIAGHFDEQRWPEVWLLLANEMNGEYLVPRLKRIVDRLVGADQGIQDALAWADRKAKFRQRVYFLGIVALNAQLLDLASDLSARINTRDFDRHREVNFLTLDCALARDLDRALDLSRGSERSYRSLQLYQVRATWGLPFSSNSRGSQTENPSPQRQNGLGKMGRGSPRSHDYSSRHWTPLANNAASDSAPRTLFKS